MYLCSSSSVRSVGIVVEARRVSRDSRLAAVAFNAVPATKENMHKAFTYCDCCCSRLELGGLPSLLVSWLKAHPWSLYRQWPYMRMFLHGVSLYAV